MSEEKIFLGAALNGVQNALLNKGAVLAEFPRRAELEGVEDDGRYPLSLYTELCDYLESRMGQYAWLKLGRKMAVTVMDTAFPPGLATIDDAITQIQGAHQVFCTPAIGAFEVVSRGAGGLSVRYTAPYNCTLQEGLFYEVAIRYGAANATVRHAECRRKGAPACLFDITY